MYYTKNLENNTLLNNHIEAASVHDVLKKHMLVDGFEIVLDLKNSHGSRFVDAKTGKEYIDFFSFFASSALGMNHPKMQTEDFKEKLLTAAMNKPSNSDMYSVAMAEFVSTFSNIAMPQNYKYAFFIEGGTLAVENGLKVAFDWKVKKNFKKGYTSEKGHQVIHFKEAFHGRSGYTMSLTNTDPNKIMYFPKFNWPRITNPKIIFPLHLHEKEVIEIENKAINEIYSHLKEHQDDVAVIILEPIQAEGGDNFFRPEFLKKLREIADENEILLMFDEVQTGLGITGKWWASEHYVMPDIISFGKKMQVCGIMVSDRIDDIEDHVFRKSSRINSTWGGNLTDMVRATRILEIMVEDEIVERAATEGIHLLSRLNEIENNSNGFVKNSRGLGMMCSFDLPTKELRNEFLKKCYEEQLLILGCGEKSVRFRTALTIPREDLEEGLKRIEKVLSLLRN